MKKLTISLLLILLISCYKIPVNSLEELNAWIYYNIQVKPDKGDYWQYPGETLKLKMGDCEDMCILFMYLARQNLNKEVVMLWTVSRDQTISHMVCEYKGKIYDPLNNKIYNTDKYLKSFPIHEMYDKKKLWENIELYRRKK